MSVEGSLWIGLAEKLFGIALIVLSIVLLYFTFTSTTALSAFTGLFGFLGAVVLVAGVLLIIIKPPE